MRPCGADGVSKRPGSARESPKFEEGPGIASSRAGVEAARGVLEHYFQHVNDFALVSLHVSYLAAPASSFTPSYPTQFYFCVGSREVVAPEADDDGSTKAGHKLRGVLNPHTQYNTYLWILNPRLKRSQ